MSKRDLNDHQGSFLKLLPLYLLNAISAVRISIIIVIFTPIFIHGEGQLVQSFPKHERYLILSGILSLYPFGQLFTVTLLTKLSRKYGRRIILTSMGMIGSFAYLGLYLSIQYHLSACIILMCFLSGLTDSIYVVSKNVITDLFEDISQRALYFSYLGSAGTVGFIIAPCLAYYLTNYSNPTSPEIALPFLVVGIAFLCASLLFYLTFAETTKSERSLAITYENPLSTAIKALTLDPLKKEYRLNLFVYLIFFLFQSYYPIYLTARFSLNIQALSTIILLATISSYLSGSLISKLVFKRFEIHALLRCLLLLTCATSFLFSVALMLIGEKMTLVITIAILSLTFPCAMSILSNSPKANIQGKVLATSYLLEMGAQALCSCIACIIAAIYIPLGIYLVSCGALLLALNKNLFIK